MSFFGPQDHEQMRELTQLIRWLNQNDHSPATSGNYSLRGQDLKDHIIVSESGVDKQFFQVDNLIPVNLKGELHPDFAKRKASDETGLHLMVYKETQAGCVLHSHHLNTILFGDLFPGTKVAWLENMELLKGLAGIKTHQVRVPVPIFDNTQDIAALAKEGSKMFKEYQNLHGFLLRGHGLTCWGKDLKEAKRHLEVFEYLFAYYLARRV